MAWIPTMENHLLRDIDQRHRVLLVYRLNPFSVWFSEQCRYLVSNTHCTSEYSASRHHLSTSHLTTNNPSQMHRFRCSQFNMCDDLCAKLLVTVSLPLSFLFFLSSIFSCLYPFSSPFFSFAFSTPSIPLSSLPYFHHHRQHGESSASWQHI